MSRLTVSTLSSALKDMWDLSLGADPAERSTYYLISKYRAKISERLLRLQQEILERARPRAKERFEELVYAPNPFLEFMKKDRDTDRFSGKYLPVPLKVVSA